MLGLSSFLHWTASTKCSTTLYVIICSLNKCCHLLSRTGTWFLLIDALLLQDVLRSTTQFRYKSLAWTLQWGLLESVISKHILSRLQQSGWRFRGFQAGSSEAILDKSPRPVTRSLRDLHRKRLGLELLHCFFSAQLLVTCEPHFHCRNVLQFARTCGNILTELLLHAHTRAWFQGTCTLVKRKSLRSAGQHFNRNVWWLRVSLRYPYSSTSVSCSSIHTPMISIVEGRRRIGFALNSIIQTEFVFEVGLGNCSHEIVH